MARVYLMSQTGARAVRSNMDERGVWTAGEQDTYFVGSEWATEGR